MEKIVVADSDIIIALLSEDDASHSRAVALLEKLISQDYRILYPATVIVETTTTLQIKFADPVLAGEIVKMTEQAQLPVETVDQDVITEAMALFNPEGSKKNTLFDAVVLAVAKRMKADAIFSLMNGTEKGFKLVSDIL